MKTNHVTLKISEILKISENLKNFATLKIYKNLKVKKIYENQNISERDLKSTRQGNRPGPKFPPPLHSTLLKTMPLHGW